MNFEDNMCVDLDTVRARLRTLKRLSLVIGVLLVMIAMLFFWTGFSVPDWLELKMSQEAMEKKFGLWLACSIHVKGSVLTCKYWATSNEFFPGKFAFWVWKFLKIRINKTIKHVLDFLKTTQVLITLGCILGTFSLGFGLAAFFLNDRTKISIQLAASLSALTSGINFIFVK